MKKLICKDKNYSIVFDERIKEYRIYKLDKLVQIKNKFSDIQNYLKWN